METKKYHAGIILGSALLLLGLLLSVRGYDALFLIVAGAAAIIMIGSFLVSIAILQRRGDVA